MHGNVAVSGEGLCCHGTSPILIIIPWTVLDGSLRLDTRDKGVLIISQRHFWELNVLETITSPLLVLANELTKLATAIGSKTIQVATFRQRQSMSLTTRYGHYFFVC